MKNSKWAVAAGVIAYSLVAAVMSPAAASEAQPITLTSTGSRSLGPADLNGGFVPLELVAGDAQPSSVYPLTPGLMPQHTVYKVVGTAESDVGPSRLRLLRRFVGRSESVLEALRQEANQHGSPESAAVQAAVWDIVGTSAGRVADDRVRKRAAALEEAAARDTSESDPRVFERTAFSLSAAAGDRQGTDQDIDVALLDQKGGGIPNETVIVKARNEDDIATVTGNEGSAHVTVGLPPGKRAYVASWKANLLPGMLLRAEQTGQLAITAEGVPVAAQSPTAVEVGPATWVRADIARSAVDVILSRVAAGTTGKVVLVVACIVTLVPVAHLLTTVVGWTKPLRKRRRKAIAGVVVLILIVMVGSAYYYRDELNSAPRPAAPPNPPRAAHELKVARVAASSKAPYDGYCHAAGLATDGDPKTAWVSAPGVGTVQSLALEFDDVEWIQSVFVSNGNQRTPGVFNGNGKAASIQIIGDNGWIRSFEPDQARGRHEYQVDPPMLTQHVVVRVAAVSPGWNNVAIADIQFQGTGATKREASQLHRVHNKRIEAPGYSYLAAHGVTDSC